MKAIHRSLTGRSGRGGRNGLAFAGVIEPGRAGVAYGDIVTDKRGDEFYVIQSSDIGCGEYRVTAVDRATWTAIRAAEQSASGAIALDYVTR